MPKIYPRKKVRFPGGVWKYVYSSKSYNSVEQVKNDTNFVKFIKIWGNGVYEYFCPEEGKIIKRLKVKSLSYRTTANKSGLPIKPSKFGRLKHQRVPECSSCYNTGFLAGYKKGYKFGDREGYNTGWYDGYQRAKAEIVSSLSIPQMMPSQPMPMYQDQIAPAKALPFKNKRKRR